MDMKKPAAVFAAVCAIAVLMYAAAKSGSDVSTAPSPTQSAERITQKTVLTQTMLPFSERRCRSAELAPGEEQVAIEGSCGLIEQTELITYENGRECLRAVSSVRTLKQPTEQLVLYGEDHTVSVQTHPAEPVASDGILHTPEGEELQYSRVLSCTATAYSCEGYVGTTAIGTTARVGAVAVDPKYIPYGTKMYIVSDDGAYIYGFATAEDCGNFRGCHVDLYFDTVDECWNFGRRTCTVYILS